MDGILALTFIFFVYAIGDMISTKTKAVISMLFVASIIFMVGFWVGIPATIFDDSALKAFTSTTLGILLVNMGTTINLKEFCEQWKTFIVALIATIAICLGIYFIGALIIDKYYALVGAPICAGGVVSFIIMSGLAETLNMDNLSVFGALVLVGQGFFGFPIASYLCKDEAKRLKKQVQDGTLKPKKEIQSKDNKKPFWRICPDMPEKYNGDNYKLFKLFIVSYLSTLLSAKIGVNTLIICLILGVIFTELGFLEENALKKGNGFTFVMAGMLANVFGSLANTTPALVLSMLQPLLVVLILGVVFCAISSIIVGKLFKLSWQMSFAIGITALFGFPGTYIIPTEVSEAVGETEEEKEVILENILPKMLIAGMVSVSIVSGILAGIMVNWI